MKKSSSQIGKNISLKFDSILNKIKALNKLKKYDKYKNEKKILI
jgi:hypothetical protein